MKSRKEIKVSRGYRLKPSTQKLLSDIQERLKTDPDTVISAACVLLQRKLRNNVNILNISADSKLKVILIK